MYMVTTMFGVSLLIFGLTQLLPGNVAVMILGQYATEESIAALETQLGLNQPPHIQYVSWMTGVLTGNWGQSYIWKEPVLDIVIPRLIRTLQLATVTMILMTVISLPLGILASMYRGSYIDSLISGGSYIGISIPDFVTATILLTVFAGPVFQIFPINGYAPLREGFVPWLSHIILPAVSLTIIAIAHVVRQTRTGMTEALQSQYVRTARLKGLSEWDVVVKHAVRNGLLPAITVIGFTFGWLIGSVVIVEEVFGYPGIGQLAVQAIKNRDMPVVQISILIMAMGYLIGNTAADILYAILDPRIEYGEVE
jgi:peptide/nickel transport system permease protein